MRLCGISSHFWLLSPSIRQVTHALLTRPPLETDQIRRSLSEKGLRAKYTFDDIIHKSAVIDATIDTACRYAASDSNVIIVGETGTGKELFAQSIHNASSRKNGPFVAINCAALPENLLEASLFGYDKKAYFQASEGSQSNPQVNFD